MSTLNYFIEANICLVLFYAIYVVLLSRETNFGFSRIFLLGAAGLSLLVPALTVGRIATIPSIGSMVPAYLLPELTIGEAEPAPQATADPGFATGFWILSLYFAVASLLLLRSLYRYTRLRAIIREASVFAETNGARILSLQESATAFSMFRNIVIGNAASMNETERDLIIRHEMVHVKLRHTWDILALELLCIVFWINPVVHAIKKKLMDVHEFQADQKASEGGDVREYCSLLARVSIQSAGFTLANHFNKSLTIKRINMMKTIKRKTSPWKLAMLLPAVAGVVGFIACQDQVMSDLNTVAQNSSIALDLPEQVAQRYDQLSGANPEAKYVILELQKEGQDKLKQLREEYGLPSTVEIFESPESEFNNAAIHKETKSAMILHEMTDKRYGSRVFAILEYTDQVASLSENAMQEGEVFLVVEETAYPEGGIDKLYAFLNENMSYPAEARKAGITGRVFIEFVVEKDGTLTNFRSVKGIGHGCDDEAIRVLSLSPPWNPGQHKGQAVRQKMVMPIVFNL